MEAREVTSRAYGHLGRYVRPEGRLLYTVPDEDRRVALAGGGTVRGKSQGLVFLDLDCTPMIGTLLSQD
jgi:hypothetical protein